MLVKHRAKSKDVNTLLDNASETHNVSIAIEILWVSKLVYNIVWWSLSSDLCLTKIFFT